MGVAVITGASSGLGVQFFYTLLKDYPHIEEFYLIARRKERLENLAKAFPDKKFHLLALDLSKEEAYEELRLVLEKR